jgi:hypothetical protein
MSKSFSREAKTHTHRTEQLEIGKKNVSVEKGGGNLYSTAELLRVYTYTPSPADCRLARPFRTSSLLLTVPDAHTHTRLAQCMSSLDVVSTSLKATRN